MPIRGKYLAKGSSMPKLPDDGKLRLYSMVYCPSAHRVLLVLEAKKLDYHTIHINILEKPEWFTQINPLERVPALEIPEENGAILIGSRIISEYLDETYPDPPLRPSQPIERARDRIVLERFAPIVEIMKNILKFTANSRDVYDLTELLKPYEDELGYKATKYFGGTTPGFLDYMMWPIFERMEAIPLITGEKFEIGPNLDEWCKRMKEDSAVKLFYHEPEKQLMF